MIVEKKDVVTHYTIRELTPAQMQSILSSLDYYHMSGRGWRASVESDLAVEIRRQLK